MVLTLILLAATISQPIYQNIMLRAREAALRDTLFSTRSMIDRFTLDLKRPPESLAEMVEAGYLGDVPIDPITRSSQTWLVETEDFPLAGNESVLGIVNVHPSADGLRPDLPRRHALQQLVVRPGAMDRERRTPCPASAAKS